MSASLKDAAAALDFDDNHEDGEDYETCGESMLEQARRQAAEERHVAADVPLDDIKAEVSRMRMRLQGILGKPDFEDAYRVVIVAGEDEDEIILDLAEVIGMDQLHLLPRFQDLKALEEELARRL